MILPRLTNHVSRAACAYLKKSSNRNFSFTTTLCKQIIVAADKKIKQTLGVNLDYLSEEDVNLILEPYAYSSSIPISETRSSLMNALNHWMNIPEEVRPDVEELIHFTYENGYIFDDIRDSSNYRRGLPTPHKMFGIPRAIMCGSAAHLIALKRLVKLNNIEAVESYIEQYLIHLGGQCKEVQMRDTYDCPTVEEYQRIYVHKVQPTMNFIIKIMQAFSDCKADFNEISKLLAVHYQSLNDLSNLADEKCWGAKGFCEDIAEGNFTLPTVHAINTGTPEGNIVATIMRQKEKDLQTLKYCHSLLVKLGSIDFAKEAMSQVEEKLMKEIERLGGNPVLVDYINTLTKMKYDEGFDDCYKVDSGNVKC